MKKFLIYSGLLLLLISCSKTKPLHIGAKDFTEQLILAEIIAQLAEYQKIPVKRSIPYGDTFSNFEAVKNGDLDLYVEYNGTGLTMLGQPPINNGDKSLIEVRRLFQPLNLEWLNRLGFANNYVLLMRKDRALNLKIDKISDLIKIQPTLRMAMEPEFLERPLDGLPALQRRYGLNNIIATVIDNDKSTIYQALLDDKVDVAEGFSTEGRIEDFGLTILEDDLNFFPVYEPSPLVRNDTLERFPELRGTLEKLTGLIDTKTMRQMNREVELEGQDYQIVAQNFLMQNDLIHKKGKLLQKEELVIAAGLLDERSKSISIALRAVRKVFPGRSVKVIQMPNPEQAILEGKARLAILGAESFFTLTNDFLPETQPFIEAVGVIGTKMVHLITLQNNTHITSLKDMKNLGVGAEKGASDQTAGMILNAISLQNTLQLHYDSHLENQIAALKKGQLDGLLLIASLHHEQITAAMNEGLFKLISLKEWQEGNHLIRFPFFRLARIPSNTYEGQTEIIETVSTQDILAGSKPITNIVGDRGPATVIATHAPPLSDPIILKLNKELKITEKLDPTLPSAEVLKPRTHSMTSPLNPSLVDSIANLLMILLMGFFAYLFLKPDPS